MDPDTKCTHEYRKITINWNNKKKDIEKDTQPEGDKLVNETWFDDELSEFNYYKIIISDRHKYTKHYIINILLNYVTPETKVLIKYETNGNGANLLVDYK